MILQNDNFLLPTFDGIVKILDFYFFIFGFSVIGADLIEGDTLRLSVRGVEDHLTNSGHFHYDNDPKTVLFKVKEPSLEDRERAIWAYENPVSVLTINASLSLRLALRRLLRFDVAEGV